MTPSSSCRSKLLRAILLAVSCQSLAALGQTPATPTLDDVVQKLQANLDTYEKTIPGFLADEHMDSTMKQYASRGPSAANYETIAESVFRLRRELDPDRKMMVLNESREIKIINGRPASGRDIDAPAMVSGAFSGGLAVVSKDEEVCSRYTLDPIKPRKPIVVHFATFPVAQRPKDCILTEDGSGRVTIDPASMQIMRIEVLVPHHVITPQLSDGHTGPATITRWDIQVDYKPVVLNARTFWLPVTITSTSSNDQVDWSFRATYRNYHLLEVHSRILAPDDSPKP